MKIRERTKNAICCKGGSGGGQKTAYIAKRDQGVDKYAICCKEESGGGQKRHLLQRRIRGWTKTPSAANGDQGVDNK
jgi:hypothetical protein